MNRTTNLLFFLCLLPLVHRAQDCTNSAPAGLFLDEMTSCSAKLHWKAVPDASEYKLRYSVSGTKIWSNKFSSGTDTFFVFTGLEAGTLYEFQVRSTCANGTKSAFKKTKDTTLVCDLPLGAAADSVADGFVKISFQTLCPSDSVYCRYKPLNAEGFTVVQQAYADSILLEGILPNVDYEYQVSACPAAINNWTAADTFSFGFKKPNILVIVLDDSRYDYFSCNGAPDFFQTPAMDRIAGEGVNFRRHFVSNSLCAPSRATMLTGLLAFKTGVLSNGTSDHFNTEIPNLFQVLNDQGYFTAMIGKNQFILDYDDGYFDYWLDALGNDADNPIGFNRNGQGAGVSGYLTDILTDTVLNKIETAQEPFFIWLAYRATHTPLDPTPESSSLYLDETLPLNSDTMPYTSNYPSWIDELALKDKTSSHLLDEHILPTYQVMHDVDRNIDRILNVLDSLGIIDHTLIMLTSDNGHMLGEHQLNMKRVAYEPSIHVPMFVRYPAWFPQNTEVTEVFTTNLDLAPTVLQAAGLPDTFAMDGFSLKDLFSGSVNRPEFYYHYTQTNENQYSVLPYVKAIRDHQYKYIYYGCSNDTTEEFFDLQNDPLEETNLVNHSAYDSLIQIYRNKLQEQELLHSDTLSETLLSCYIKNPVTEKAFAAGPEPPFIVYPNPAASVLTIELPEHMNFTIRISDALERTRLEEQASGDKMEMAISGLPPGIYAVTVEDGFRKMTRLLIVNR